MHHHHTGMDFWRHRVFKLQPLDRTRLGAAASAVARRVPRANGGREGGCPAPDRRHERALGGVPAACHDHTPARCENTLYPATAFRFSRAQCMETERRSFVLFVEDGETGYLHALPPALMDQGMLSHVKHAAEELSSRSSSTSDDAAGTHRSLTCVPVNTSLYSVYHKSPLWRLVTRLGLTYRNVYRAHKQTHACMTDSRPRTITGRSR